MKIIMSDLMSSQSWTILILLTDSSIYTAFYN